MKKSLASGAVGMVAGTLLALSWTGESDLKRIEARAQEFSTQATSRIESLKNEISSTNVDNSTLIKEVEKLQKMVDELTLENYNANSTSQALGSELKKANTQTKETADKVEQILDLEKLK